MSSFKDALMSSQHFTTTEKGAKALATLQPMDMKTESVHGRVAFFFKTVRSLLEDEPQLFKHFQDALNEDALDAMKLLFHLRNCRKADKETAGGKGERELFRLCVKYLKQSGRQRLIDCNIELVPQFGRWDDVLYCGDSGYRHMAQQLLKDYHTTQEEKKSEISLASKWAPRYKTRKVEAGKVIDALNSLLTQQKKTLFGRSVIREAEYRKLLSACTNHLSLLERLMCEKRWDEIDFNQVPSRAMNKYGKNFIKVYNPQKGRKVEEPTSGAFLRHCEERFTKWRNDLKRGVDDQGKKVKINASQVFPHELVYPYLSNEAFDATREAQWAQLEKELTEHQMMDDALYVVDVSGSMSCSIPNSSATAMSVAVALGLLGSRCLKGPFKDLLITFSSEPQIHQVRSQSLFDRVREVVRLVGYSTNLQAVFDLMLKTCTEKKVSVDDVPKKIVLISDMEFDMATNNTQTNFEAIQDKYQKAGYPMPTLVFWNVCSSMQESYPVSAGEHNTVLLSGFSTSMLHSFMRAPDDLTPYKMVRSVIDHAEYNKVCVPE